MRTDRENQRKAAIGMAVAIHIFGIAFVLIWCLIVASMGAWFMLLFAVPIAVFLAIRLVFLLKPAKNDPWDAAKQHFPDFQSMHSAVEDVFERAANSDHADAQPRRSPRFCYNCSCWIHNNSPFCPKCGRPVR